MPFRGPYYVRTADEITAGVTPTDYTEEEGNVLRYGATGDGATDDRAALQAAIDVMTVSGGTAFMPAGTYGIGTSIEMKSNVILRGDGYNTVIKLLDNADDDLTTIQSGTSAAMIYTDDSNILNFSMEYFRIDGNDANNANNTYWGIGLADATDFHLNNLRITDCYGAAIGTFFCHRFTVADILIKEITGTTGNPGEGLYIRKSTNWTCTNIVGVDLDDHLFYLSGDATDQTSDGVVNNCNGINCGRTSNSSAFNCLDGVYRIIFSNCHAQDCKKGYTIVGTNHAVQDITYNGCVSINTDDATSPSGFSASSSSGTNHAGIALTGCVVKNAGVATASAVGYGMNIQDCDDVTILSCVIDGSNYDNIFLDDVNGLAIIGCSLINAGQEPSVSGRAGIRIDDVDDFYIAHNDYRDNQAYGLNIQDDATNGLVDGGYFNGNGTGSYVKNNSTATTVIIRNIPEEGMTNASTSGGRNMQFGDAAPTTRAWIVGDIVWNVSPTAGGNIGWVCTAAGSPGTWKTFGDVAA